jgi:hypothetical protein
VVEDPLIEALESRREERERILSRELLDEILVELRSLRGERHDAVARDAAVGGVERRGDDVHAQDHPEPAAVRIVIHLARCQRCRIAVVEDTQLELGAEDGCKRAALPNPREGVGDEREDVETHDGEP